MEHKPCFGKQPQNKPEIMQKRGCVQCPDWNCCLSITQITKGKGLEAWLGERKKEKENNNA